MFEEFIDRQKIENNDDDFHDNHENSTKKRVKSALNFIIHSAPISLIVY